jgi:hypothetical protein
MSQRHRFDLDELIVEITAENKHSAIDVGPSVGEEQGSNHGELGDRAELFRVSDHKSVWTGSFERKLADVESSQQGIATHVLESISVEILQTRSPDLRTADPEDQQAIDCERGL